MEQEVLAGRIMRFINELHGTGLVSSVVVVGLTADGDVIRLTRIEEEDSADVFKLLGGLSGAVAKVAELVNDDPDAQRREWSITPEVKA